jgi:ubiquitin carboxyl-terminal hydrolase 5/13
LSCFNGGCTGNDDRNHSTLHYDKSGHALVVNIQRKRKAKENTQAQPKLVKLAIAAETEEDSYDFFTTPKCLACGGKELPRTEKLEEVIAATLKALSSSQQSEVKAWEEEILPCEHTKSLKQLGEAFQLEASGLATCSKCDLDSNLWLCLTCGNLGCGRAQFGGVGGNSHGLTHFEQSGHPVSVKQGTITAEGTADVYCYACNDARIDPNLAAHLSFFGINVMDLSKTEKSMTELQLEQNLRFDFSMTGEDGKELEPVFGPGLTGLRNLGNSCYLASVLQSLFSLPAFHSRYLDAYRPHTTQCTVALPATCFECQMTKVADGLLSGRYSVPRTPQNIGEGSDQPIFQEGIRPSMFKALVGKGHEEFSTMRQQDADEFLKHLFSVIQRESAKLAVNDKSGAPTQDPTECFSFGLEQRLQCLECHKVRYSVEAQDAGISLPVPLRIKKTAEGELVKGKAAAEGDNAQNDVQSTAQSTDPARVEYEEIDIGECLDIFTAAETLDYHCPSCDKSVKASKRTLFTTFPDVLAFQVRRFQLVNWVPQKVNVPILVTMEGLVLDKYLGHGKREDEVELPASSGGGDGVSRAITFDAGAMSQLTGMGFPEIRCQRALLATGNTSDAEAAMNWLFAHMEDADIDDPIDLSAAAMASGAQIAPDTSALEEMGFSKAQARKALRVNGNNPEIAVAWLFENADDPGEEEAMSQDEPTTSSKSGETNVLGGNSNLPARYRLKAFISHKGPSVHSGHYVAHIRKGESVTGELAAGTAEDDTWVLFNDEKVVKAPLTSASARDLESDVGVKGLSKLAYEYIWERQS